MGAHPARREPQTFIGGAASGPGVAAPSLFCEHKKLRSVCFLCGASRTGAVPAKGPTRHDVDDTWRALRLECHRRFRLLVEKGRSGPWDAATYWSLYDKPDRRGPIHSEEEDPSTYRGAFYLAMVKLFDLSVDGRRIQGYNGLQDWDETRDYLFRAHAPDALPGLMKEGRLRIHGGNAAWPRQQIASDLVRSPRLKEAVETLVFGKDGRGPTPDVLGDAETVRRMEALDALARAEGIVIGNVSFASKLLHAFAPARWPAYTNRTSPDVGEHLGAALPPVETPADYLRFADAVRAFAKQKGHPDLVAADIAFSNAYEELDAEGDDEELPPLDE